MSVNFNDTTPAAPSGSTNVTWQEDGSGNISAYVSNAATSLSASAVDLTAQNAAISTTTILTPGVAAFYRVSAYLKVTTAASTGAATSTLGPVTITFNDGTDSVPQSIVWGMLDETGAVTNAGNSNNTTVSLLFGEMVIFADSGAPIQYAVAYASDTASEMVYEVHIRIESL